MICYRDMTFCSAACGTRDCPRNPPDDLQERVDRWWGGPGGLVAWSDFSPNCDRYAPAQHAAAPASAEGLRHPRPPSADQAQRYEPNLDGKVRPRTKAGRG